MKSIGQQLARRRARQAEILSDRNREARRVVELDLRSEQPWHADRIAELTRRLAQHDARAARLTAIAERSWRIWRGS